MKVLALVPNPVRSSPGQRYRIEQWEPLLREHGIEIEYSSFLSPEATRIVYSVGHYTSKIREMTRAYWHQWRRARRAGEYDLVYVFREAAMVGPAIIESTAARTGTPLVYDFDDAIFIPYISPANGHLSRLKFFGKTGKICEMATEVMAGNQYLADYASQKNRTVSVVPTTLDTQAYRPELRKEGSDEELVIGWTGSHSTIQHLNHAIPALEKLAKRRPFKLVVVSGPGPRPQTNLPVDFRFWSAETEVASLADIDVGIMPLPDEPWTRGKCGMKALQFMGLGIPCVVSPVGVNVEIVRDGENGYLAGSTEQWVERLDRLLADVSLRERLGKQAAHTVHKNYSAVAIAPTVAEIFKRAAEAPRRRARQRLEREKNPKVA